MSSTRTDSTEELMKFAKIRMQSLSAFDIEEAKRLAKGMEAEMPSSLTRTDSTEELMKSAKISMQSVSVSDREQVNELILKMFAMPSPLLQNSFLNTNTRTPLVSETKATDAPNCKQGNRPS
jgi:hypothetical protein